MTDPFGDFPGLWEVINIEQTRQDTFCIVKNLFEEGQARMSHAHQPTPNVGRRPHNCSSGIGYAKNAGADFLGA
jgi:hypothetical protein